MNKDSLLIGVLIEETTTVSFIEVCQQYNIPESLLTEMIEHGLFSLPSTNTTHIALDQKALRRIESAIRLHRDLDVNLPGVALALDLLDEMEQMRHELNILRKHLS
ncbi:MAG: chaperone modulator CbpM [bacterium]|nr:chaperone modulator CbpM [bacterium]